MDQTNPKKRRSLETSLINLILVLLFFVSGGLYFIGLNQIVDRCLEQNLITIVSANN